MLFGPAEPREGADVPDQEFGIEVPEADRLEQLREAGPAHPAEDGGQDQPALVDAGTANPADVLEQHIEVPADEEEDR